MDYAACYPGSHMRPSPFLPVVLALAALASSARGQALAPPPPAADIHNVYAWMTRDGRLVNLAMTLSPFDQGAEFDSNTLYVFHLAAHEQTGGAELANTRIICRFRSKTDIECWIGSRYLRGNPSNGFGNTEVQIFAGRRSDPFFHDLDGFENAALRMVQERQAPIGRTGCRLVTPAAAAAVVADLTDPPHVDRYEGENVLALVLQLRKSLLGVTSDATILSVWASTHAKP